MQPPLFPIHHLFHLFPPPLPQFCPVFLHSHAKSPIFLNLQFLFFFKGQINYMKARTLYLLKLHHDPSIMNATLLISACSQGGEAAIGCPTGIL